MKAIILAAGEGKRFDYFEQNKPKCLMEIGDTTLLNIQIDTLYKCGIEDICIVRGYNKNLIDIPGITYYDNEHYNETNVFYSLFLAQKELNEEVIVLYSDIYYEEKVIKNLVDAKHDFTIGCLINYETIHQNRSTIALEDIELIIFDADNKITKVGKNASPSVDQTLGQFIGIFKLSCKGCEQFKAFSEYFMLKFNDASKYPFKKAWLSDFFSEMINLGIEINTTINESGWFEVNTYDDYQNLLKIQSLRDNFLKVSTDWGQRALKYNNLDWVNNDKLLEHLAIHVDNMNDKTSLLDVGTGTGKILIYLDVKKGSADYHGCDVSEDMMNKIDSSYTNEFKLQSADVTNLEIYQDNYFDYITARMVFHHVNNLNKAMQEIFKKLKSGGKCIICEGNPPSLKSYKFYKEMFYYKENRHTFLESDLIKLFIDCKYANILTETVILENMSLNNWLDNSGLPHRNIDIIKNMHYNCSDEVKKDYNMKILDDDILMDWKFSIITGTK